MAANWQDLVAAVCTAVQALNLTYSGGTSLPSSRVYNRKVITDRNATTPFVMVAQGGKEERDGGTFEDNEVVLPVIIVHAFASNQTTTVNADLLTWRQSLIDMGEEWERTIAPTVPTISISTVDIETEAAVDPGLFKEANLDVGGIMLKFRILRVRTR